jgi:hypothetical protein
MDSAFVLDRTKCDPAKTKADKLTKQSPAKLTALPVTQTIHFLKFCENISSQKIPNFVTTKSSRLAEL